MPKCHIRKALFLAASIYCIGLPAAQADSPEQLRERYTALGSKLQNNAYGKPIHIESSQLDNRLRGDVYAVLNARFDTLKEALKAPNTWCEIMILPINVKYCHPESDSNSTDLSVFIGKKETQDLDDAHELAFHYQLEQATPNYFNARLNAPSGPVGTRDYRIQLEGTSLPDGSSFIHLSYSYGYGTTAKLAMKTYLGTVASNKVGFSRDGNDYVDGVRGLIERNTMRYYLAIEAYFSAPDRNQLDRRLENWFAATEKYPRQLHEMEWREYRDMKHEEYSRQQRPLATVN
ncbi:hypothetical protein IGB42_02309 [Andreprevotia sp. IGB-42]|uniref:hypothetical protein n=1 Tax=Andreprevotia sp. IGB-42 TaxID=2497473 RepID=UPI0013584E40|nr:hypothetical protein [Andreprevotia sp. IGB-42]KAF0813380.1 hypothetical protein IGB42_02309 [Andreprevotia sp. IGB-42]